VSDIDEAVRALVAKRGGLFLEYKIKDPPDGLYSVSSFDEYDLVVVTYIKLAK
jgi:hypothetical protein